MANSTPKFTDHKIKALKPKDKPYLESEPSGLYVRVRPTGRKVFMTVYTFEGKQRWYTIGRYPGISLTKAREEVKNVHKKVDNGIDPTIAKQIEKTERIQTPTVAEFAETYLTLWAEPKKKSAKEDRRILEKDIIPLWGERKLKDIRRVEIINMLDSIALRGPIMANRTLAVVRKMLNFALKRGVLEYSPCQNIDPPGKEVEKERYLSNDEIKALYSQIVDKLTDKTTRALMTILATAQRPNEVATMEWSEIEDRWWTIPAKKTKSKRTHRVYLNSPAIELIGKPQEKGFVFPSDRKENISIHPNSLAKALREHGMDFEGVEKFTPHDLRRTASTHMAELGHGQHVDKVLNHSEKTVTKIYDRYKYDNEKKEALAAWGEKLQKLMLLN